MIIYEKCKNINNNHNIIEYESFKDKIIKNSKAKIDINLKLYQKYYIQYLFEIGKTKKNSEASIYFEKKIPKCKI